MTNHTRAIQKIREEFQVLTEEELYSIYKRESTYQDDRIIDLAKEILQSRSFNFNNLNLHKAKWELEQLQEEIVHENSADKVFTSSKYSSLFIAFFGLLLSAIIVYNYFLGNIIKQNLLTQGIMFFVGIACAFWGIKNFVSRKNKISKRDARIKELQKIINQEQ